ncbi:glucokinase [Pseudemcibacter aquimaris]|uniref:glucokinase n=1 Tax=Pseudemcibacter aquimaris TaxID=2857064 RepID=UPI00201224E1|nr:glucokinase [Pseudemcibacter aquimaris]MCC3861213.1 glucokinase [Pseudemcibacter aquimaris]WDU57988.1 glucokinase [Pseudemcibacter aquimaris]
MHKILVSDVGGTNGRFAIATLNADGKLDSISNIGVLQCREYKTFSLMLKDYLSTINETPAIARFAIAGAMTARRGNLWHFNWEIVAEDLENEFHFENVTLLNDYEALVHSIPHLSNDDLKTISPATSGLTGAPFSVFGVGSGLGGAIGVPSKHALNVVPTEVGHISFAPKTERQQKLLTFTKKSVPHVSIETFMSGNGICRIYDFLNFDQQLNADELTAAQISQNAQNNNDPLCVETMNLFFEMLASIAGDISVAQGAKGGVFIGGGIIPKNIDLIGHDDFIAKFTDKGPMTDYNKQIPVSIITSDMPALIGSAMAPNWND